MPLNKPWSNNMQILTYTQLAYNKVWTMCVHCNEVMQMTSEAGKHCQKFEFYPE